MPNFKCEYMVLIPTQCQTCGARMLLIQVAVREKGIKSVARGECRICGEDNHYTVLRNLKLKERADAKRSQG